MEQEEYTREEIDWSYIEFIDNQDILDMIEKVEFILLQLNIQFLFRDVHLLAYKLLHLFIYSLLWFSPGKLLNANYVFVNKDVPSVRKMFYILKESKIISHDTCLKISKIVYVYGF